MTNQPSLQLSQIFIVWSSKNASVNTFSKHQYDFLFITSFIVELRKAFPNILFSKDNVVLSELYLLQLIVFSIH